jgi:hypothetical protein
MVFDAVVGQREKSFFDAPWDNRSVTQRTVIATNAVSLHVKPLPTEGRPANFNGLIGDFTLTAASPTTEAAVGDPIPLTLTIRGVTAPDLAISIEPDFKPAPEGWEAGPVAMGSRTFTTTVRPRNDRVTQIPPIALPYFDAITGTYKAARSNPIPLKVKPSREVTAADALRPQANGSSAPSVPLTMNAAPAALTSLPSGLGPNAESTAALVNQRVSILALTRHPGFIAFLVAPPALLAIARWRPKRDPMRSAIANARRQLHSATSTQAIADALRTALGPALGIAPEAVTPQDLGPPAHGTTLLSPQIASEAVAILNAADAAAFGKASPDMSDLKRRTSEVLDRLRTASPTFRRGERSAAR